MVMILFMLIRYYNNVSYFYALGAAPVVRPLRVEITLRARQLSCVQVSCLTVLSPEPTAKISIIFQFAMPSPSILNRCHNPKNRSIFRPVGGAMLVISGLPHRKTTLNISFRKKRVENGAYSIPPIKKARPDLAFLDVSTSTCGTAVRRERDAPSRKKGEES